MIWVVNSNSNVCRIYDYQKKAGKLILLKEINHPENRMKTGEFLTSDKPGHYQSSNAAHGTFAPHSDPKEVAIDQFSREIAKELDHGRKTNIYDKLILINPPHMNGLIHLHLDKHVKELVMHNIPKDLLHLPDHELLDYLQINTRYPGENI
jgi:protein required for attachment to host cells